MVLNDFNVIREMTSSEKQKYRSRIFLIIENKIFMNLFIENKILITDFLK